MTGTTEPSVPQRSVRVALTGLAAQTGHLSRESANAAIRGTMRAAELAEEAGFDSVWTAEHHGSPDGFMPAPLVLLGALATATDTLDLGTNVLVAPLWDPMRLAEEAAVVDQISGGRLVLGVGLGYLEAEYEAFGADYARRGQTLEHMIDALRRAWRGEPLVLPGGGPGPVVTPPPYATDGPPIWVGGFVKRGVDRARRLGSGYLAPTVGVDGLRERIEWLLEDGEIPGFTVSVTCFAFVSSAATSSRAPMPGQPGFAAPRPEGAGTAVRAEGRPDQCIEQLRPLVECLEALPPSMVGQLGVCLTRPDASEQENLESVRLFGAEVLPALVGS